MWAQYEVDAFVVVYSITDRRSFQKAADLLDAIRSVGDSRVATILVANKSDLVRSRIVGEKEGKLTAEEFDAKYTEVSAVLNHKVDHLLAGVLKQIRLIKAKQRRDAKKRAKEREVAKCLSRARQHLLGTCFKPLRGTSKSCENLLAL
ncbi:hypothetical protein NP493_119g06024 [Ridgeia piscesae]|uniref:Uncharacterized protein n=1 Tax=Ridgeia piscesae TaxID=27915 RepID=A0AAD9UH38_RIDPI|nr:hypothetical protein NP493_119g06024 [Ridgeia piscesae]